MLHNLARTRGLPTYLPIGAVCRRCRRCRLSAGQFNSSKNQSSTSTLTEWRSDRPSGGVSLQPPASKRRDQRDGIVESWQIGWRQSNLSRYLLDFQPLWSGEPSKPIHLLATTRMWLYDDFFFSFDLYLGRTCAQPLALTGRRDRDHLFLCLKMLWLLWLLLLVLLSASCFKVSFELQRASGRETGPIRIP